MQIKKKRGVRAGLENAQTARLPLEAYQQKWLITHSTTQESIA